MGAPREGILSEEPLYDPKILERLDFSKARTKFSTPVSAARPGEGLRVRPLRRADYRRGFLQLLSQLTSVGDVSEEQFLKRFDAMQACPNTYYVTVIEDTTNGQVIGASTLVIEQKFIHGCNVRGRAERPASESRGESRSGTEQRHWPRTVAGGAAGAAPTQPQPRGW
ncbi:probable glucosamine 6-phosphate N-acetyltransferase isoform X2 [Frankliniella occidentalis]|uniref:Glucosamine 6-phosphate N-acetyltransferase n=1 Tax=Frankliniella occidentalis TaxID=133901 RepID=A0A9C6X2K1_FRAOC|nr:probable glucosamine 6-phosphate N-acetyltransferase isoform X2 [Frankliniella occidentalis]